MSHPQQYHHPHAQYYTQGYAYGPAPPPPVSAAQPRPYPPQPIQHAPQPVARPQYAPQYAPYPYATAQPVSVVPVPTQQLYQPHQLQHQQPQQQQQPQPPQAYAQVITSPPQQTYENLTSPDKERERDDSAAGESADADNDTAEDGGDADAEGEDVVASVTVERSGSVPEFVKKLYRMLEESRQSPSTANIVSWGLHGDTFVVKERTDFERTILPQHFKHNNFASFVRQLNKYDFHKIRNTDDGRIYGDQAWEFQHPKFQYGKPELLKDIVRKVPSKAKPGATANGASTSTALSATSAHPGGETSTDLTTELRRDTTDLQSQVDSLTKLQADMATYLQSLSRNYHLVVEEVLNFRKNMAAQDQVIRNLVDYLVRREGSGGGGDGGPPSGGGVETTTAGLPFTTPYAFAKSSLPPGAFASLGSSGASNPVLESLIGFEGVKADGAGGGRGAGGAGGGGGDVNVRSYTQEVARASFEQMHEISRRVSEALAGQGGTGGANGSAGAGGYANPAGSNGGPNFGYEVASSSTYPPSSSSTTVSLPGGGGGLTVFTVGGLAPRETSSSNSSSPDRPAGSMRVTRTTLVPPWAVPPRVLVVDDDDINRKLSTKLLQVFGCSIDVAVDGLDAVERMGVGNKYDIVLMDIVMPNLDGVSATQSIRKFDVTTPIISMTSNTTAGDCLRYLENGMNDILPKPFNKQSLLGVVERYCNHLVSQHVAAAVGGVPKPLSLNPPDRIQELDEEDPTTTTSSTLPSTLPTMDMQSFSEMLGAVGAGGGEGGEFGGNGDGFLEGLFGGAFAGEQGQGQRGVKRGFEGNGGSGGGKRGRRGS
ncbi:kinase-regulated stress-responsive transcription factor skn7 [Rhizophlyctis rosea]|nr:kinase-regulated stress-responsive transcription factor skn7 [Rhizophlyctis rosea]